MKILIVSDLHGNMEALQALPEDFDEMWVLGDLVSYGPDPSAVVEFVRERATVVVRGNHDHAAGTRSDPRCSLPFREMAKATLAYTDSQLNNEQRRYLAELPLSVERTVGGCSFMLCHAVPSEPLYTYCPEGSPQWCTEAEGLTADILLVGHTHLPFRIFVGSRAIVNPGSVGQPKHGQARACYAVWEDGHIEFRSCSYRVADTVRKIEVMPVPDEIRKDLAEILQTGMVPGRHTSPRSSHGCSDF